MTRQILNKLRAVVAVLGVAGASVFTAVPMDGCDGTLNILIEGVGFGDDYDYDDGYVDWDDDDFDDDDFFDMDDDHVDLL